MDERREDRKRNNEMHKEKVQWKEKRKERVGKRRKKEFVWEGRRKDRKKKSRKKAQKEEEGEGVMWDRNERRK